jgi:hypothetical protein
MKNHLKIENSKKDQMGLNYKKGQKEAASVKKAKNKKEK